MARLFPERLPLSVRNDPLRAAECSVYEKLSALPGSFTVFCNVSWLGRSDAGAQDGEADFVVAHPERGLLVLEVKGGGIAYDALSDRWTSTNRWGEIVLIKDPVEQARRSKHALLRTLQEMPGWGERWVTLGHAVVFPDVVNASPLLRPDLPAAIVLDRERLQNPTLAIEAVFDFWGSQDGRSAGLQNDGMRLVTNLLARSFQLRTPLGVELQQEDERIIQLTEEQMRVLDILRHYRRAAVQGCAGSGKTMLAVEKTHRLATQGFDVLLVCFNVALANYLAERLRGVAEVYHFHGLCEALIEKSGLRATPPQDKGEYYDRFLPEMLLEAIDALGPQFDAIVVDEGQDFKEDWWVSLHALLRDEKQGIFYVFFDDNQNLYKGVGHIPGLIDTPPFSLTRNCRNTQHIHRLVARFHPHGAEIQSLGPQGRPPIYHAYDSEQTMLKLLRQTLHQLVYEEGVAIDDLVILTPRAAHRSVLQDGASLGNFTLSRQRLPKPGHVWVSTIHAFKGLERKVVLLAEITKGIDRDLPMLLYVGCSRARTHLVVFHSQEMHPEQVE